MFTVAGIAIASEFAGRVLENMGQGDKVVFVNIAAYIACAGVALHFWWAGVKYVAYTFGVSI